MNKQKILTIGLLISTGLLLSACNINGQKTDDNYNSKTTINTVSIKNTPSSYKDLKGHNSDFTITAAEEEGYWYSRYNLGAVMARSGIGERLMPDPKKLVKMMAMTDSDFDVKKFMKGDKKYGDGDHFVKLINPYLIATVYPAGSPFLIKDVNPKDLDTLRWDSKTFRKNYTGEATGWTIHKEIEWMKMFHNTPDHFGTNTAKFGAQWRMIGMILQAEAQTQFMTYLKLAKDGKIRLNDSDKIVMLEAISNLHGALKHKATKMSSPELTKLLALSKTAADELFTNVSKMNLNSIKKASLAAQAYLWYGANVASQATIKTPLTTVSNYLSKVQVGSAVDNAYIIRGLIESERGLGVKNPIIAKTFQRMLKDYNWQKGYFINQVRYSIDNIGVILGAINSVRYNTDKTMGNQAKNLLTSFFESAVNLSGLQQSAPPLFVAKSKWEYKNKPKINFRYPTLPIPPQADFGDFGIAPVFAAEITMKPSGWEVTNRLFDTAGAMHTSNEMIWFHNDEISGFPNFNK